MRTRIFINHPMIGTVMVPKSRPHFKSKRFSIMDKFMWSLMQIEYPNPVPHSCKICKKMLLNPQSILLHIGNGCEKQKTV